MANILSNFEGRGPTEVAYKKKSVFLHIIIDYIDITVWLFPDRFFMINNYCMYCMAVP